MGPAGPTTHYELFAALHGAGVRYLLTGAAALALHGVPRLTPDLDLLVQPDPENVALLERLLLSGGYAGSDAAAPTAAGADVAVRRFRHPASALGEIDVALPSPELFERLAGAAAAAPLVDLRIPLVGAEDLRAHKLRNGRDVDLENAAALALLATLSAGAGEAGHDTRSEQIRKFSRWSVAARLDWLLAAARLAKGMSPEAKPMTRGLARRRGWFGPR